MEYRDEFCYPKKIIEDGGRYWKKLILSKEKMPLKIVAERLFSIIPHTAAVERSFSQLGMISTKRRNRISTSHLFILGQMNNFLRNKKPQLAVTDEVQTKNQDIFQGIVDDLTGAEFNGDLEDIIDVPVEGNISDYVQEDSNLSLQEWLELPIFAIEPNSCFLTNRNHQIEIQGHQEYVIEGELDWTL